MYDKQTCTARLHEALNKLAQKLPWGCPCGQKLPRTTGQPRWEGASGPTPSWEQGHPWDPTCFLRAPSSCISSIPKEEDDGTTSLGRQSAAPPASLNTHKPLLFQFTLQPAGLPPLNTEKSLVLLSPKPPHGYLQPPSPPGSAGPGPATSPHAAEGPGTPPPPQCTNTHLVPGAAALWTWPRSCWAGGAAHCPSHWH